MSEKRKRDAGSGLESDRKANKKQKRGFTVGPQNLPDGTYRRKSECRVMISLNRLTDAYYVVSTKN